MADTENKFMHFVRETQVGDTYIYREQLKSNAQRDMYFLRIEIDHLQAFDEGLVTAFRNDPVTYINVFESAVQTIYRADYFGDLQPFDFECPKF